MRECDDLVVHISECRAGRGACNDRHGLGGGWAALVILFAKPRRRVPPVGAQGATCQGGRRLRWRGVRRKGGRRPALRRIKRVRGRARCGVGLPCFAALRTRRRVHRSTAVLIHWQGRVHVDGRTGGPGQRLGRHQDGECDDVVGGLAHTKFIARLVRLVIRGQGAGDG